MREPQVQLKGNGEDTVTILVYMNGSDLESDDGSATADLAEMIGAGSSSKVNLLVETLGTKKWQKKYGISSKETQIHKVDKNGLTLVRDGMGQLDCTKAETLADFIKWGTTNYPADRYILLFWNHGGGPVYGFGVDQYQDEYESLTIDEMQKALAASGVYFDFIGMDCCIMSSLELCCALYDYCDYLILSEDFEPGIGWSYTPWLKKLYSDTSIPTTQLGKVIVDSMVGANTSGGYEDDSILALLDVGCTKLLYTAWTDFAYANEDALLGTNYSRPVTPRGKAMKKGFFSDWFDLLGTDDYSLSEYYITDILEVAGSIESDESNALKAALDQTIIYLNSSGDSENLTGISVSLPYGDRDFYNSLKTIYKNSGIDADYIAWLEKFTTADGYSDFYDYDNWDDDWSGWDSYDAYEDWDWDEWDYYDNSSYWESDDWGWEDSYFDSWTFGDWLDWAEAWGEELFYDDYDYGYDDWY